MHQVEIQMGWSLGWKTENHKAESCSIRQRNIAETESRQLEWMVDSLSQLTFLNSDVKVMTVSLAQTVVPLSSPQQIFVLVKNRAWAGAFGWQAGRQPAAIIEE